MIRGVDMPEAQQVPGQPWDRVSRGAMLESASRLAISLTRRALNTMERRSAAQRWAQASMPSVYRSIGVTVQAVLLVKVTVATRQKSLAVHPP